MTTTECLLPWLVLNEFGRIFLNNAQFLLSISKMDTDRQLNIGDVKRWKAIRKEAWIHRVCVCVCVYVCGVGGWGGGGGKGGWGEGVLFSLSPSLSLPVFIVVLVRFFCLCFCLCVSIVVCYMGRCMCMYVYIDVQTSIPMFMSVRKCILCGFMYFMTMYSAVRIPLVSNCAI